ncbi:Golgin-45 [Trichoplax sp. H2]|nr:Golgin-45 [Trichoplax sp. H2]|eukprot:RDD41262.1 Golgin-45 [Trichoplax sp. H2]
MHRKGKSIITTAASPLKPNHRLHIFNSLQDDKSENLPLNELQAVTIKNKITQNGSATYNIVESNKKNLKSISSINDKIPRNSGSSILWPTPSATVDNAERAVAEDVSRVASNNEIIQQSVYPDEQKSAQAYQNVDNNNATYKLEEEEDETDISNLDTHRCSYRDLLEETKEQLKKLDSKLEAQLNVNAELKRLLVASIGDDIGLKLEELTKDKTELAMQIEDYTKQIVEDREKLDNAAMKCNVWRSKYLASRVMIEQLIHWKLEMYDYLTEYHNGIKNILNDRVTLAKDLLISSRNLESIHQHLNKGKANPVYSKEIHNEKDVINVCKDNKELIQLISNCLSVQPDVKSNYLAITPSDTEHSLQQLTLEVDETGILEYNLDRFSQSLAKDVEKHFKLYRERKSNAPKKITGSQSFKENIHKIAQNFDFPAIDCCSQCKGEILLV